MTNPAAYTIGVSLKMYFGLRETVQWCEQVARIAADHEAIASGAAELFVLPVLPALLPVADIFAGTPISVGAQDLFWEDLGAWTGHVGGPILREAGARYAEVGHAERRALGETDEVVSAKVAAALRNELTPVICVGEESDAGTAAATQACVAELDRDLQDARERGLLAPVVVAYEPRWAIGASRPAGVEHIRAVCAGLARALGGTEAVRGHRVIYGGSAGPGLLTELDGAVTGLFLGRFAHDPYAVGQVLDEVLALRSRSLVG